MTTENTIIMNGVMDTQNCKYHPDIPARWSCEHCQIDFCKTCIKQDNPRYLPDCPVCQRQLLSLGSGNLITPFWLRLGKFFLYPMQMYALLFISILTVIAVFISGTFTGFLITVVLGLVFMKYCFAVIEDTALGHLKPLPVSNAMISSEMELPFKLFALMAAIQFGLHWVGVHLGFVPYLIALIISNLAVPANIMVLAMEHSFFAALNPVVVFPVILRIGAPYLFLCLLLFLLQISEVTTLKALINVLPYDSAYAVFLFTTMFFTVVMAHMLGYVLYQYHEKLGFVINKEADEADIKPGNTQPATRPEIRTVEILVQEGKHQEALDRLSRYLLNNPSDREANTRYFKLLEITGETKQLFNKAQKYISYLIAQNELSHALSIFNMIHRTHKKFRPAQADERLAIAKLLQQGGQAKAAVSTLNNLHVDFPSFKKIPEAYLLVARILCEQMNDDDKSRQVLQFLMQKYPENHLQHEINEYYKVVAQLADT